MCDMFIATPDFTKNGTLIFGKNSDREPNEAQGIIRIPAIDREDKEVECTYKTIAQVAHTHEVLLSRPFKKWGAEMGMNEFGLVIGISSVDSKLKPSMKNEGLIAMDLVRLALERCSNSRTALDYIIELIQTHGQEGCSGYENLKLFHYHSFMIADFNQSWILETAGKHWVAKKISGFYSIANAYTIGEEFDLHSEGITDFAFKNKWIKKGKNFNFKDAFGDEKAAKKSKSIFRTNTMNNFGNDKRKSFVVADAIQLLSMSHIPDKSFNPSKSSRKSIAQYATSSSNWRQTNNSMVAEVSPKNIHTCWFTGTSSPKTSLFKPFFIKGSNIFEGLFKEPGMLIDDSLWWQAEAFHREVFVNYKRCLERFGNERNMLQQKFLTDTENMLNQTTDNETLTKYSNECLRIHLKKIKEWRYDLKKNKVAHSQFSPFYNRYIQKITKKITPIV
ncbi:MAG: acyl-CoA--6-aminopenicillanic acid acyltransferase [Flammeovirgaceae bacterium]